MDPSLIANSIRFLAAKQVWDSAAITYFDGIDTSQVYDFWRHVTCIRQIGGSIEKFYNDLQGLRREINFLHPIPMQGTIDIQKYNSIIQKDRVYIFLDGLDDQLDNILSDVLQLKPFSMVVQVNTHVQWEDVWQTVITLCTNSIPDIIMTSKGIKTGQWNTQSKTGSPSLRNGQNSRLDLMLNLMARNVHCGNTEHIREICSKLHVFQDWGHELWHKKNGSYYN